MLVVLMD